MVIYIIELENSKYYVGKSDNHNLRIENHNNNLGSEWTKLYKPVRTIDVIHTVDDFDEDKYTLATMRTYGIDNVRGGSFSQCVLTDSVRDIINTMLCTDKDLCYVCGGSGHFANQCTALRKSPTLPVPPPVPSPVSPPVPSPVPPPVPSPVPPSNDKGNKWCKCVSSWVSKHRVKNCKLKKVINATGKIIVAVADAIIEEEEEKEKNNLLSTNNNPKSKLLCTRCGRNTHTLAQCYAVKHIKGYILK